MEELGIEGENTVLSLTTLQSENHSLDINAVSILENSAKLRGGHYELALPWNFGIELVFQRS